MDASTPHSILAAQALEALDDLYHSTDGARGGRSEMWEEGRTAIRALEEQLEAMQAALTELLSWHPQLPQVREKVMHPQHQEAVERAEALVASNPASSRVGAGTEGGVEAAYGGGAASLASPARSETADESSPAIRREDR